MNVRSTAEFVDLLWALYDEQLTAEQEIELERELCRSAAARRAYVRFIGIQGLLGWNIGPCEPHATPQRASAGVPAAQPPAELPPAKTSPVMGFLAHTIVTPLLTRSTVFWLVAILTNALLVCTLAVVLSPKLRARLTGEQPNTILPTVSAPVLRSPARLASALDARWNPADRHPAIGEDLPAGMLRLLAGVVELEFRGGAHVSFVGPSEFDLRDSDQVHLESGELRALVPRRAVGFRVLTPTAEVVDLGTEFGVRVTGLETFVHCVRGKVRMQPNAHASDVQAFPPRQLSAGHSGSIDASGWVEPTATAGARVAQVRPPQFAAETALEQPASAAPAASARASQLINVQIASENHPAYTGTGVVKSDKNSRWNITAPAALKPTALHDASGAPTNVRCSIDQGSVCTTVYNACGDDLHDTYCFVNDAPGKLTVSGLAPRQAYDLYLLGTSGLAKGAADAAGTGAPEGSLFTVDGQTKATTGLSGDDRLLTEGKDYVAFRGVVADANGVIHAQWVANPQANPPLNNNRFGPFNGLQIVGPAVSE